MTVGNMSIREERPSYVRFERKAVEDRAASLREGRLMTKDVDFALITPQGSKDIVVKEVLSWFVVLDQYVREERIPTVWVKQYKEAYAAWKSGQEPSPLGTPIKGWQVLSPAQQANIIGANILTVEDLAQANDEARRRIGMGAQEHVDKAIAWLKAAKGAGIPAQEMAAMHAKIRQLEAQIKAQADMIAGLKAENEELSREKASA